MTQLVLSTVRQKAHWSDWLGRAFLVLVLLVLLAFLAAPLLAILVQALQDDQGRYAGLANFLAYARTPTLLASLWNSLWVSAMVTVIVIPMAFVFAYALVRACVPGAGVLRAVSLIPLLAPSLLSAISLIYWFGNQGVLKEFLTALGVSQIYGPVGVVIAQCFSVFPHAVMILVTALSLADARLYEAADALGTGALRKFFTITLPGAKYGLISAALVTFTLVITDFGIPKVIGGNFNMMATDVFKLVIGQQDFAKGAVVALLLLAPAVFSFGVDRYVSRRQTAMLTARAVPLVPKPALWRDRLLLAYCLLVSALMLAMLGMAVFASFASFWPYNLAPSLQHYRMGLVDGAVAEGFVNSLKMAAGTAVVPMAVPGLVLGLGYIFFFNEPGNPLQGLYHTMTLLTLCTIVHFYTTGHLTAVTALKSLDADFEAVSASLKVPFYKTFWRVTVPICTPALIDIARYFFINAMTTISAVVFLYSPETKVASIAILNLDEAGDMGAAAAMAVLIAAISATATGLFALLGGWAGRKTQAWRRR
jgi:iron(III) transport system permease protein